MKSNNIFDILAQLMDSLKLEKFVNKNEIKTYRINNY